jgi:hypothetical protein
MNSIGALHCNAPATNFGIIRSYLYSVTPTPLPKLNKFVLLNGGMILNVELRPHNQNHPQVSNV